MRVRIGWGVALRLVWIGLVRSLGPVRLGGRGLGGHRGLATGRNGLESSGLVLGDAAHELSVSSPVEVAVGGRRYGLTVSIAIFLGIFGLVLVVAFLLIAGLVLVVARLVLLVVRLRLVCFVLVLIGGIIGVRRVKGLGLNGEAVSRKVNGSRDRVGNRHGDDHEQDRPQEALQLEHGQPLNSGQPRSGSTLDIK
jgi:hypothetical protein